MRIMKTVDPHCTGYVTFDAFMQFMSQQTMGADTVEQMVNSFRTLAGDTVSSPFFFLYYFIIVIST